MISIFDKRPPFVRFETREIGINEKASEAAGRPIPNTYVMAMITPHGSKDVVEKIAVEWLKQIKDKALAGDYPAEWVQHFKLQFDEWMKGNELPREGTPVATWPVITQEASKRIRAVGYTTVEDLAQIPDSGLAEIGMDGRYWRDAARGWVNDGKDKGINARAIAEANVKIERLEQQVSDLMKVNVELRSMLGTEKPSKKRTEAA
jgi:hypothetical protein